ncbi:hypothetical protein AOC36_11520 [Erysipelothrix larvae]|uniref:PTS-associated protein n=1 Tax=Erysipelothrix larvae TaxID=1514105 RepID=A0A109UHQ6_9FIRM|nr:MupG family TIM beta-alpha barrel fold protein [Erysipelothrix larvae]AMC94578.1 hypothetical protein AOC36_11520 [Erysipelothrix larvae]
MKRRLGISIYPDHSNIEADMAYLDTASHLGFSRLFASMLEVSGSKEETAAKFKTILKYAKDKGFEVILDVAPNIFEQLQISYDDLSFFKELHADGIRLDVGFDGNKEALLTYNEYGLIIELNMSNDVAYLDNILTYQANKPFLYGCHNFYPQSGTGLDYDFFVNCSKRFKRHGLRTAAFITSSTATLGPWNINDGLPTLELHRSLPIDVQAKHLFATGLIDDVIIGNAYASDEELESLSKVNRYQLSLRVDVNERNNEVENDIITHNQHQRRGDISSSLIRSTEVRKKYAHSPNSLHSNEDPFQFGDVVIGNDCFGKYKNELQIVLQPHTDPRKNKVGQILEEEKFLLKYISPWSKFRLEKL